MLAQILKADDVVLTLGAGSIGAVAPTLPRALGGARRSGCRSERRANRANGRSKCCATSRCANIRPGASAGPPTCSMRRRRSQSYKRILAELPAATPVHWLGLGSNLLVRDGGMRGAVIATASLPRELERLDEHRVRASAGLACMLLAKRCVRWHLGPAAFFAGIPGTVGGALAMNAGAFGGETWTHVESVTTIDRRGELHERPRAEFEIGYRDGARPGHRVVSRRHVSLRPRRRELDGRDQDAARATQRGAAAWVSQLRLRVPQPARRFRRPPHRAGRIQGVRRRRCDGVRQARQLHPEYRRLRRQRTSKR